MKSWITLQLSDKGEYSLEEETSLIEGILRKLFPGEYFLPLYYDKTNRYDNKIFLFKGYIFLEYQENYEKFYERLSKTPYFLGPLTTSNKKCYLLKDSEIKEYKKKLAKLIKPTIKIKDKVLVLDGKYKNLRAVISEIYTKTKEADLIIELKCMKIIAPKVPLVYLKKIKSKSIETLQDKIIQVLKNFPHGLTRKETLSKLSLAETEEKRLSTSLARMVKKKALKLQKNINGRFVFILI